MRPKTRYSLIAAGFVAFIILSPFIVLFVTGTKYDFKNGRFVKTGAISVYTNPKNVAITINGKGYGRSNRVIRFLESGTYAVELKRPGYLTWSKSLFVREQYVTWTHQDLESVTLFLDTPDTIHIADNVSKFFASNRKVIYLHENFVSSADLGSPLNKKEAALPAVPVDPVITASPDENYFLISSKYFTVVYDAGANTVKDISEVLRISSKQSFEFGPGNDLYALEDDVLSKIDWRNGLTEPVLIGVSGFHITGQSLYYIQKDVSTENGLASALVLAQLPNLEQTVLIDSLPNFADSKIYISDRNQIFILADNTLYSLGNGLHTISQFVTDVSVDNADRKLLLASNNEVSSYNLDNNASSLIVRSSQSITEAASALDLGWVFFVNDGRLQSIEADTRGGQNNYTFAQVSPDASFFVNDMAEKIILLDSGTLKSLEIR